MRVKDVVLHKQRINSATIEVPVPDAKYYLFEAELELYLDIRIHDGPILSPRSFVTFSSKWVGWFDECKQIELRVATPVDPIQQTKIFREQNNSQLYIINNMETLYFWMHCWGGSALIHEEIMRCDEFFSTWLEPFPRNLE